jgi:acyl-CoA thioesterase-1
MRPMSPKRFLKEVSGREFGRIVVCAGDSITHGLVNPSYVRPLQERLRSSGVQVVNAGVSGDLAVNLLARLDEIVACRPDVITVLIGTNDVASQIDEKWKRGYMRQKHLSEAPTRSSFQKSLTAIIERLVRDTEARVALSEIPILGEDLGSPENARVRDYNSIVHEVAVGYGCTVLPLYQRLVELLPGRDPVATFDGSKRWGVRALVQHYILRRDWDRISRMHGLTLLVDHIHLNETASLVMADLVEDFVGRS